MHASSHPSTAAREPAGAPARPRIGERGLARLQAASGLAFALFLALHLGQNLVAPLGRETYGAVQAALRVYYQHPLVEVVLVVGAVIVHVTCGALRARTRRRRGQRIRDPQVRRHRRIGWLLALIVVGHVLATRGVGLLFAVDVGFDAVAFSLADTPAFFYPYYLIFGAAAAYHGGVGGARALRVLGLWRGAPATSAATRRGAWALFAAFVALLALALLAFGGRLFPVGDPLSSPYARVYTEHLR